ncbi:unnamed protein product [Rhizophagus irregularis]|uniref:Restriction of telomere capping protein 4 n=1 Tax=Rhizophagus irregularis TaxID=588596 RepID=A0A915YZC2_9GLOM|nr:unnamed protein product [Rhizophagus irregularis]
MINKLAENAIQEAGSVRPNYYIVNIITGECPLYLDYIWNGSLHDVCKHVHAARIYNDYLKSQNHDEFIENITCKFVTYFKNKQRVLPSSSKNLLIYNGNIQEAYQEIIQLYNLQGNLIFNHVEHSISNHMNDPFRPDDLNHHASSNYGVPSKPPAKPRKRNPLQMQLSNIPSNPLSNNSNLPLSSLPLPFSVQKRQTKRIRQNLQKNNNFHNKENIQTSSSISNNTQFILPSPKKSKLTEFTKYDFDEFDGLEPLEDELNIDQMKETCPFCDEILPDLMSDKMKLALDRINNKQGKIEESDRIDFCHTHFAELLIVPSGIANKYPLNINFDELPHLYQEVGHRKAATPMMLMSRFESLRDIMDLKALF